jgi:hypothetical protein
VQDRLVLALESELSQAERIAALDALFSAPTWSSEVSETFRTQIARTEEPVIVAGLSLVPRKARDLKDDVSTIEAIRQKCHSASAHIRGRAVRALAYLGDTSCLRAAVADSEPYVQAEAFASIAQQKRREFLDVALRTTADERPAISRVSGWTALDGKPGNDVRRIGRTGLLGEAAAIATLRLIGSELGFTMLQGETGPEAVRRNSEELAERVSRE